MDTLQLLLNAQREMMDILGIPENDEYTKENVLSSVEFQSASIGLVAEAVEVLDTVNIRNRPWKTPHELDKALSLTREELIDVLFFSLEIANLLHMSAQDVCFEYNRKFAINCARILEKRCQPEERRKLFEVAINNFGCEFQDNPRVVIGGNFMSAAAYVIVFIDNVLDDDDLMQNHLDELVSSPVTFLRGLNYDAIR